jgi:RNA polymerase sigma factor (sigma-70 family)
VTTATAADTPEATATARQEAVSAYVGELFAEHRRMVLGLSRLLLRDQAEAEDAAQQVFLSAHQAVLRGSPPRDPTPWLAAITRNECRARIRARMREPLALPELPSDLPDPLASAIRAADLQAVWAALGELPWRQRRALVLRELGGLSYSELGRALGVSQSAVESLLFRARQHVRALLAGANARLAALPVALKAGGAAVSVGVVATGASGLQPIRVPYVAAPPRHVQVKFTNVPPPRLPRVVPVHEVSPAPDIVRHRHGHHAIEHPHEQTSEGPGPAPTPEPAQVEASHDGPGPGDGVSSSGSDGHDGHDGSSGSDSGSGSDHSGPG